MAGSSTSIYCCSFLHVQRLELVRGGATPTTHALFSEQVQSSRPVLEVIGDLTTARLFSLVTLYLFRLGKEVDSQLLSYVSL